MFVFAQFAFALLDIEAQLAGFRVCVFIGSGSGSICCAGVARVSGFESGSAASFLLTADGDVAVGLSFFSFLAKSASATRARMGAISARRSLLFYFFSARLNLWAV